MTRYVVDASVAVEYLLRTPLGRNVADAIEHAFVIAPELLDVEVLSALRRAVLKQRLTPSIAEGAIADLVGGTWSEFPIGPWRGRRGGTATTSARTTPSTWRRPESSMRLS